jgi:hypothetical protein
MSDKSDADLLTKLTAAVEAVTVAETTMKTAKDDVVLRMKELGTVCLEVKKEHPKVKDFVAFIRKAHGLGQTKAYDAMKLVGGSKTDDELKTSLLDHKKKAAERKQKSRAKGLPKPEAEPVSVTDPNVTESVPDVTAGAEDQTGEATSSDVTAGAGPDDSDFVLAADPPVTEIAKAKRDKASATALANFKYACNACLPKLNDADLATAKAYFATRPDIQAKQEAA